LSIIPVRLNRSKYIVTLRRKLKYCIAATLSYVAPHAALANDFIDRICRDLLVVYKGCVFLVPDYWSIRFFDPSDEAFVWRYMNVHEGTFVDVGAHVGKYAVTMARKLKGDGMVLAFEPHPVNFKYLLVNLRLNGLSNVLPFNMACYSSNGCLDLYVAQESSLHSLILPRSEGKIKVKACTIDFMVEKLRLKDIRLRLMLKELKLKSLKVPFKQ